MNTTASAISTPSASSSASYTLYTPLEHLLLFQSLAAYGTRDEDFDHISQLLTSSALVRACPDYDAHRLSAAALHRLYAQLVEDEGKGGGVKGDERESEAQEGGMQMGSKKRKVSNSAPSLKPLQDAGDTLPMLVDLLYARYRDSMIKSIREDEQNYAIIKQDMEQIERGEWDQRILKEDQEIARKNNTPPVQAPPPKTVGKGFVATPSPLAPPLISGPIPVLPAAPKSGPIAAQIPVPKSTPVAVPAPISIPIQESNPAKVPQPVIAKPPPVATQARLSPTPVPPSPRPDGLAITDVLNSQPVNSQPVAPSQPSLRIEQRPQNGQAIRPSKSQQRQPSNGQNPQQHTQPHGPPLQTQPHGPPLQTQPHGPPLQPQPPSVLQHPGGNVWQWEQPYGPQLQSPQYQASGPQRPPGFNTLQYPPNFAPPRGSFSAPHSLPSPHPHVPSSPSPLNTQHQHGILLPPPNGIPPNGLSRPPSSPGMPLDALADIAGQQYRATSGSPMTPQPIPNSIPQSQMQVPAGYPIQYQQRPPNVSQSWNQPYPPQFQQTPQQYPQALPQFQSPPSSRPTYTPRPELVTENRTYNSPYNASQGPRPTVPISQGPPKHRPGNSGPNTPVSQGHATFRTGSGTRWTPNPTASTPRPNQVVPPPRVEAISPILRPKPPPIKEKPTPKEVQRKETPKAKPKPPLRLAQNARADSTASSVVTPSLRSQSIASHADETSTDNDSSRPVKQEVATPRGIEDTGDTTADESSTLPRVLRGLAASKSVKRKRHAEFSEPRAPLNPPSQVLWTRAFPKISAPALDSVVAHKNASTFGNPVKDRDAPGYKHLILRPQDLKSIRTAINNGHKAAASAAVIALPDLGSQASVLLPISEDLVPPKGIINNAQLEKELMRVFANAIMFNADPDRGFGRMLGDNKGRGDVLGYEIDEDGIVKDTRAMFADVEKIITDLRSAERRSEELREASIAAGNAAINEDDETTGEGEGSSVMGSVAKRRKKA